MEILAIVWVGAGIVAMLGRMSRLLAALAVLGGAVQVARFDDAIAVLVGGGLAVGGGWLLVRHVRRRRAAAPEPVPRAQLRGGGDDEGRFWQWLYATVLAPIELFDDPLFGRGEDDRDAW